MNDSQVNPNYLLDATDCLEAIGVIRGWKNFLFLILILSLLLTQAAFWLVNTGYIDVSESSLSQQKPQSDQTSQAAVTDSGSESESEAFIKQLLGEPNEQDSPAEPTNTAGNNTEQSIDKNNESFVIKFEYLTILLRFINALLILAATFYCLTMLFSLKISLLGRLGGINHICRAFFLSLLMLILLLPWQYIFGRFILGAMYTSAELQNWYLNNDGSIIGSILYYLRFTGYWLLIFLLLIFAQLRSARWAKAILRRLEII